MSKLDIASIATRRVVDAIVDRLRLWDVRVAGIEVTQSIQHYQTQKHMQSPQPDNSVQLVAYKAAYVRIYMQAGLLADVSGVTARLQIGRRGKTTAYNPVATLNPIGFGSATAHQDPDYRTERNDLRATINFIIPAGEFHGTLKLTAILTGRGNPQRSIVVIPDLVQTLRVRAILINYNGPSSANTGPGAPPVTQLNLPAPTLADVQTTSGTALAAMPVQAVGSYASAGTLPWALPLDDPLTAAGSCTSNWGQLLTALQTVRNNDGNRTDVVYFGLLPNGTPLGTVVGCGDDGLGAATVGNDLTFMHEIGHGYGFPHAPCGNVGTPDPNYPTYAPYAPASIGEFGLDIRTGRIYDPLQARDYMSYCAPRWMSLYHHGQLIEHPRLAPRWLSEPWLQIPPIVRAFDIEWLWWPDPPWRQHDWETQMNNVIALVGEVDAEGTVSVHSVARIAAEGHPQGTPTPLFAHLVDEAHGIIAHAVLLRTNLRGCCCDSGQSGGSDPARPPYRFSTYLPDVAAGTSIRIVGEDGEIVWERHPSGGPPRFTSITADVSTGSTLNLGWTVESASDATEIWAQWTKDVGRTWRSLAIGLADERAVLPLTGLSPGRIQVRLLAHDGFYSSASEPLTVEVPNQPAVVTIIHPVDGHVYMGPQLMQLSGNVIDSEGFPLNNDELEWVLDGHAAGTGREAWISMPRPGGHELTLRAGEAAQTIRFEISADSE